MDTLFRLVSFQQPQQQYDDDQSSLNINNNNNNNNNNSTNSSSSRSSKPTHHYYHPHYPHPHHFHQEEECFNFFMDEEDFSSSSSHHNKHQHNNFNHTFNYQTNTTFDPPSTTTTTSTPTHHSGGASGGCGGGGGGGFESSSSATAAVTYSPPRDINLDFFSTNNSNWATQILIEAAKATADRNTERLHQLLWMLNEVGSPYGDVEQKLACYFTQALFTRMTHSGDRYSHSMRVAADKTFSFDTTRKMLLQFQEVSPWTTFGHVASNGAIVDAFDGESKLHILDFSTTFCTQWPTLLEAIATRMDDTPHLRITTVVVDKPPSHGVSDGGGGGGGGNFQRVMREIGIRLEKFARLMGVPFKFNVIHHVGDLSDLDFSVLEIHDDEALAINCVNSLHSVNIHRRDVVLAAFRRLNPRLVTVVEENADLIDVGPDGYPFFRGFGECLKWFRVYLESLDECFSKTSNEKLMLERAAGRALVDLLARPESDSSERRETGGRWSGRIRSAGFGHVAFSDEVCDDVRALLRRYKDGWSMAQCNGESGGGIFLSWKDQPVVWASAWKP